jgi:anti-anti-sigma factor
MSVEIDHQEVKPGIMLIKLTGRLVLGPENGQLELLVSEKLSAGYRKFVFDLSGLSHIDSTGIGRFIFTFNKVSGAGGKLCMVAEEGHVRDGFRVTRLDTVFKFFPDVDSAVSSLG